MSISWQGAGIKENPNCLETYAIFCLVGDSLNPDEIESKLKIKASFVNKKGGILKSRSRFLKREQEIWAISSKEQLDTTSLERHILFIMERLEPVEEEIVQILSQSSLTAYIHCYWLPGGFLGGPVLSPEILEKIGNLNAYLDFGFEKLYDY